MTDSKGANRLYLTLVVSFVLTSIVMGILPVRIPIYLSVICSQLAVLIPVLLYCLKRKISLKELIPHRKMDLITALLVVVITYLMYPVMVVLNAITLLFTESAMTGVQMEMMDYNPVFYTLIIAVLPACIEELTFRGVLFQSYRKKRVFTAILLSAFLFGCMHMNFNQFLYAFVMGIFVAFLVEGTGSIYSSMLAHFVLNFTGVIITTVLKFLNSKQDISAITQPTGNFLQGDKAQVVVLLMGILAWALIAIGTMAGAVAIYIYVCKRNGRWEQLKEIFKKKKEERMITIPLVIAVAITAWFIIRSIIM